MLPTVLALTLLSTLASAGDLNQGYFVSPIIDKGGNPAAPPGGMGSYAPRIETPYGPVRVYPLDEDTSNAWDRGKSFHPMTAEYIYKTSVKAAGIGAKAAYETCAKLCEAVYIPPFNGGPGGDPAGGGPAGGGEGTGGGSTGGGSAGGDGQPNVQTGGDPSGGTGSGNEPNVQTGGDPNGGGSSGGDQGSGSGKPDPGTGDPTGNTANPYNNQGGYRGGWRGGHREGYRGGARY